MKSKIKINQFIFLVSVFILIIAFSSCHERIELDTSYNNLMRVIGPEGGVINYYEYNPDDSISKIIVKLEVPNGALDSFVVFNMYEYENEALFVDLSYIGMIQNSKFLYFMPFYESYGYNEQTGAMNYHLSIDFNIPVKVTYNLGLYQVSEMAKLYRIKIPRINEWGDQYNIWVNWNFQGYPEGYKSLDLQYIINGKWTINDNWGTGEISLYNWEEVLEYNFDMQNNTVEFEMDNTDYIYVMGYQNF